MARKRAVRRKKVKAGSVGLAPGETKTASAGAEELAREIEGDGGAVLGIYREPFGGRDLLLAALPIDRVEPTPYQRDASETHVKRLMTVIEKIGRFLDPIVAMRRDEGYWTPNGNHRLQALKRLGARTVIALVVPEPEVAFKILALNTEKAHNLREKSLETIRMARELAGASRQPESDYAFEFEEPAYLTLGLCYEQRPRFSGGAYQPVLRRIDGFLEESLSRALARREKWARTLLAIDDEVASIVERLKARGLTSPYLKPFVAARINPIRFSKATEFDVDDVLGKMAAAAKKFNVERVRQEDVVRAGGAPGGDEG
jgi:ParB family transcriptional regulator, chromosome partitioning protein